MASKQELQSLLGFLLYNTKCVRSYHIFLNCMLQLLRDNAHYDMVVLNQEFYKDLKWFNVFLQSYNGVTMYHITSLEEQMHLDASLQGLGGFLTIMYTHLLFLLILGCIILLI